jgi:hypothetical protein
LMVCEFETVRNLDRLLANANMIREEFRKHFTCPMVWWVSDATLGRMIRIAPDFFSWTTSVQFQLGDAGGNGVGRVGGGGCLR